jgi:hypothetical protein
MLDNVALPAMVRRVTVGAGVGGVGVVGAGAVGAAGGVGDAVDGVGLVGYGSLPQPVEIEPRRTTATTPRLRDEQDISLFPSN